MSDGTKGRTLVHTQFDGQGRMVWQVEGLPEHVQAIHKMYQALSTLGDPVVVAEALPELVEAAIALRRISYRADMGIATVDMAALTRLQDAAAKLKARP